MQADLFVTVPFVTLDFLKKNGANVEYGSTSTRQVEYSLNYLDKQMIACLNKYGPGNLQQRNVDLQDFEILESEYKWPSLVSRLATFCDHSRQFSVTKFAQLSSLIESLGEPEVWPHVEAKRDISLVQITMARQHTHITSNIYISIVGKPVICILLDCFIEVNRGNITAHFHVASTCKV